MFLVFFIGGPPGGGRYVPHIDIDALSGGSTWGGGGGGREELSKLKPLPPKKKQTNKNKNKVCLLFFSGGGAEGRPVITHIPRDRHRYPMDLLEIEIRVKFTESLILF